MDDGYQLPLTRWEPEGDSKAIVLALHGLNDYRNGFTSTATHLAYKGIMVIAIDQRGFGETDGPGLWHGSERLTADLHTMIQLLESAYPAQDIYLLGESMGGAVALAAMNDQALPVEGIVLVAPAIWSRNSMPFYQRWALWLAAHTMPSRELTGEGLDLHPSDNIEMLRAMGRDPLVIKATRVDVLYGVTNLMDAAASTDDVYPGRMLIQYGMKDDIIPLEPTCQWLNSLAPGDESRRQTLIYKNGYHMLTRDLQADVVLDDIAQWVLEPGITLGHDGLIPAERFCK